MSFSSARIVYYIVLFCLGTSVFSQKTKKYEIERFPVYNSHEMIFPHMFLGKSQDKSYFICNKYEGAVFQGEGIEIGELSIVEYDKNFIPTGKKSIVTDKDDNGYEKLLKVKVTLNQIELIIKQSLAGNEVIRIKNFDLNSFSWLDEEEILVIDNSLEIFHEFHKLKKGFNICTTTISKDRGKNFFVITSFDDNQNFVKTDSMPFPRTFNYPFFGRNEFYIAFKDVSKGNTIHIHSTSRVLQPIRLDIEKEKIIGFENWLNQTKLNLIGSYGDWKLGGKPKGLFYCEYDLINQEQTKTSYFKFTSEFIEEYVKNIAWNAGLERQSRKHEWTENFGLSKYPYKEGGYLVLSEILTKPRYAIIWKLNMDGEIEWTKTLKGSNRSVTFNKAYDYFNSKYYSVHNLENKHLIIYNGINDETDIANVKYKKHYSTENATIGLMEVSGTGEIYRQTLIDFEASNTFILWESRVFKLRNDELLLFTTDQKDSKKQQFMLVKDY